MTIARKMTGLVASAALLSVTLGSVAASAEPIRPAAPVVGSFAAPVPVMGTSLGTSARAGAKVGDQSHLEGFSFFIFAALLAGATFFIAYRIAKDKYKNHNGPTSPGN